MNDKDWKMTREAGEWAEEIIANYLIDNGYEIIHFYKEREYDILVKKGGKYLKVEVKLDRTNIRPTINIEYESRKEPSGISVTTADYYFCIQPKIDELLIMKVSDIKEAIHIKGDEILKTNKGSYNKLGMMYRMYKDDIKNKEVIIDWRKYEGTTYTRPKELKKL